MPRCLALFMSLVLAAWWPLVMARQDPVPVKHAIEEFLRVQVAGLPGEVTFTVGAVDANNQLTSCARFDVSLPPGARPWGRTNVTVRCMDQAGWSMFVPVHVRVVSDYLVTARPLAQGQSLTSADLARQRGDLSTLPAGILTDEQQALGRTARLSIGAGRPLRGDMLQQPLVVQQNQTVRVVTAGPGFQVANEGRALNNGLAGQVVQVRLGNGQIVSGIARPGGVVEIAF
ncbi:MAG: flagellar basal body P-ring formation protein FlgA [Rhodocyclaceae bacterium]|nr:flagellar basal body P-ring formation protein FlgA [Rhodocyclaceae bacterium]MBK6553914.1 flagellar basal body P-ring formation protein FlgA [Rhodocyclaceae bacterium]MBK6678130.1 flagellar basal body P-ring formation protein FlgA [Rhodocyclaceae bacterium]MBK9310808.1 flagellar basal body P-ring formation protein FlgA [Rhodocyclaceae bacterium]MBK9954121.1 flagellar basal body P-ring formation protein FlgA [Rhodocyclaceae bacterium]